MCTWNFTFPVFRVICTHLYPPGEISGGQKMKLVKLQLTMSLLVIVTHTYPPKLAVPTSDWP